MSNPFTDAVFAVGLQKIVNDYGDALASHKTSFADASELPHPKPLIKFAMLAAIAGTQDKPAREHLKTSLMWLADWQEGVGPGPHPLERALKIDDVVESAKRFSAAYPSYSETLVKVVAEMQAQLAEFKALGL